MDFLCLLALHPVCRVCRAFKEQVVAAGFPRMGILPLISAIRALREKSDMLTPMHADCFQLWVGLLLSFFLATDHVMNL